MGFFFKKPYPTWKLQELLSGLNTKTPSPACTRLEKKVSPREHKKRAKRPNLIENRSIPPHLCVVLLRETSNIFTYMKTLFFWLLKTKTAQVLNFHLISYGPFITNNHFIKFKSSIRKFYLISSNHSNYLFI